MNINNSFEQSQIRFDKNFNTLNENKKSVQATNSSFGETLKNCIDDVNSKQIEADKYTNAFVRGDNVNIDEVMIKGEEASLSLQFLAKTRDQLVEAYKELTRMQL
ncbi:flagellar hook-basal body complex protein FliE [Clostridium weizhouense]|uniref:Flagellar hook-basal body complex protein FliE n=1 Tax=Clostridium weizhouense TaxID=2859781 RepID=A0ABS7AIR7_9CLOT|nr:flagellar hook-basal body complex protein FliE [Clostridium weizhouense]MBW6408564.1 flagellar hook-basal body complex protein FliE [Clostridium weizhouense]